MFGYGISLLLIAIGAILTWAVNVSVQGLELTTIGIILMIVGGAGVILTALFSARAYDDWDGYR